MRAGYEPNLTTKEMISIFPLCFPHLYVTPADGVYIYIYIYISQLIRYSKACDSYDDFLDRGLLLQCNNETTEPRIPSS